MDRSVVNLKTGEIVADLNSGDRIVRAVSIEAYRELQKIKANQRSFSKIDINEGLMLLKELDPKERSLLFLLQYYVSYESCLIRHNNGKDITFNDIVELSGWSRATTNETLNSLVLKNIIYKGKNGRNVQYFMNPWVVSRGASFNNTLKEMFKNYKIRSKGGITWEELEDKRLKS